MSLDSDNADVMGGKGRRESGGGSISHRGDVRMTRFIDWVLAGIGGAIMLLSWRAGDALVDLKIAVATLTVRVDGKDKRDDLQDHRLDALEGERFRGVDGYDPKDKPHGH